VVDCAGKPVHTYFMNKNASQLNAELNDYRALAMTDLSAEREEMVWEIIFKLEDALKALV
jgi:hypothetical protein